MLRKLFKKRHTVCYMVTEDEGGAYIVRVINSYKDKTTAYSELVKLLSKDITECEVLDKFTEKYNKD